MKNCGPRKDGNRFKGIWNCLSRSSAVTFVLWGLSLPPSFLSSECDQLLFKTPAEDSGTENKRRWKVSEEKAWLTREERLCPSSSHPETNRPFLLISGRRGPAFIFIIVVVVLGKVPPPFQRHKGPAATNSRQREHLKPPVWEKVEFSLRCLCRQGNLCYQPHTQHFFFFSSLLFLSILSSEFEVVGRHLTGETGRDGTSARSGTA